MYWRRRNWIVTFCILCIFFEFQTTTMSAVIASVNLNDVMRQLQVRWSPRDDVSGIPDDVTMTSFYPYTWLRDACCCPQCYDSFSNEYFSSTKLDNFHTDCRPTAVEVAVNLVYFFTLVYFFAKQKMSKNTKQIRKHQNWRKSAK